MLRLGFLTSHGGSNMQAIIDACASGELEAEPRVVISNNSGSQALVRARAKDVPAYHLSSLTHPDPDALDSAICERLLQHEVDVVCLAGYMKKVGPKTLAAFRGRILNIHPALLPKYGGQGMYGMAVHEAVIESGDRVTGVTVHLADESYDRGPILAQREIAVDETDTPETLAQRVLAVEHRLFVETLSKIASGQISLEERAPS